ncbi:MAG: Flp family type IVb pilin [Bdellovibrio sp.]|nr:MAG: Flp family type IVb pilin [Bdellovibrio sp.]
MQRLNNSSGQGLIEYLILVALMSIATLSVVRLLSQTTTARFANIINALQGRPQRAQVESVQPSDYSKRDLGNFMNGAASRKSP